MLLGAVVICSVMDVDRRLICTFCYGFVSKFGMCHSYPYSRDVVFVAVVVVVG